MPREIKMPKLSDTMEEGTINVWRKREGDPVARGDVLLEVETDKADMEYEAYVAGTMVRILRGEGETVPVGTPIAVVRLESDSDEDLEAFLAGYGEGAEAGAGEPAPAERPQAWEAQKTAQKTAQKSGKAAEPAEEKGAAAAPAAQAAPEATAPRRGEREAPAGRPEAPAREQIVLPRPGTAELPPPASEIPFFLPDPDRVRATPRARVVARERNVDLSEIVGSGPEGAILVSDVEAYLKALEEAAEPAVPGDVPVTPVAARVADDLGVDLTRVKGTGPGGRVTKRDVRGFLERERREGPARARQLFGDEIKLSQKRKFLTRQMVESKQQAPHFYVSMDVDAEPMAALRERLKADDRRVTYTHMLLKAAALALEKYPEVNATWRDDRIVKFVPINVAVAVAVGDELVAPVVKDCQGRELDELAEATDALIRKAREKKLAPEDYSEGTFTISNLGMFGVDFFYAIITPPQATVLSVGGMREVPVVRKGEKDEKGKQGKEGEIGIGRRITLGLGCDHRVLDGAKAAQFLAEFRRILEHPEELLRSSTEHG